MFIDEYFSHVSLCAAQDIQSGQETFTHYIGLTCGLSACPWSWLLSFETRSRLSMAKFSVKQFLFSPSCWSHTEFGTKWNSLNLDRAVPKTERQIGPVRVTLTLIWANWTLRSAQYHEQERNSFSNDTCKRCKTKQSFI